MRCWAAGCTWRSVSELQARPREQLRQHAETTGHDLCLICGDSLTQAERRVCDQPRYGTRQRLDGSSETWEKTSCVTKSRELLSGVVLMWVEADLLLGRRKGADGDVLALVGPGGTGTTGRRLWPSEVQQGLVQHLDGREHAPDNDPRDPASVVQVLTMWEDDWRRERTEPASLLPAAATLSVLQATAAYLDVQMRWAARNLDTFGDFHTELAAVHTLLEVATSRLRRSARANADCFDCGGALIRRVDSTTGLEEEDHDKPVVTCQRCGRRYDTVAYNLAVRASYDSGLDGWVTVRDAAAATKRSTDTIKSWVIRGLVESVCRVTDRRQLVWWPDVHARTSLSRRRSRRTA